MTPAKVIAMVVALITPIVLQLREASHPIALPSVARLQAKLDHNGAHLRVNGIWGSATQAALQRYERRNGVQRSGEFDRAVSGTG